MNDDYDFPVNSYIIRVTSGDYDFICNRNDETFYTLFNDKWVNFWEVKDAYKITDWNIDGIRILETVELSNYNKKDQVYLNSLKKKYIDEYNLKSEPDKKLSNLLFNECLTNYRRNYRNQFKDFKTVFENGINFNKIYEIGKRLYFTEDYYILLMKRDEIWNMPDVDKETKAYYIILREYLNWRRVNGYRLPFDKGNIYYLVIRLLIAYKCKPKKIKRISA